MKKLLILMFMSFPAIADWTPSVLITDWFYDFDSLQFVDDSIIRIYVYQNVSSSTVNGSIETQYEFNCKDKSFRRLVQTIHTQPDLKGNRQVMKDNDNSTQYPPRNTNIEGSMSEICIVTGN